MNEFDQLLALDQDLHKKVADQPDMVKVNEVRQFIRQAQEAGALIKSVQQREQLRAMLRLWGAYVYEREGTYPATQLAPYAQDLGAQPAPEFSWLQVWLVGLLALVVLLATAIVVIVRQQARASQSLTATQVAQQAMLTAIATYAGGPTPAPVTPQSSEWAGPAKGEIYLRLSPIGSGTYIGWVAQGSILKVRGRSLDSVWLSVEAADGTRGWVAANEIDLGKVTVSAIPLAVLPITPTPVPPRVATVTLTPSLSVGLTATTVAPPSPTPSPTATPTPAALATPIYVVQVLSSTPARKIGGFVIIRAEPSIDATFRESVRIGAWLIVYEERVGDDGTPWLHVRTPGRVEGWVRQKDKETSEVLVEKVAPSEIPVGSGDLWVIAPVGIRLRTERDVPPGDGATRLVFGEHVVALGPASAPDESNRTWQQVRTDAGAIEWATVREGSVDYLATTKPADPVQLRVLDTDIARRDNGLKVMDTREVNSPLLDTAAIGETLVVYHRVTESGVTWLWVRSPRDKYGWIRESEGGVTLVGAAP